MPDGANDTVAAIATAVAHRAGIGIVRVSGPRTREIAQALFAGVPAPRRAVLRNFLDRDGNLIDRGLALFFPMPASYTGEDVLELHAHGGVAVLHALLERVIELGVRRARPGEFTERAFLNGRMDLLQAEAVADLIDAGSVQAARAAQATLRGDFSRAVAALTAAITAARVQLEIGFDFSEEDLGDRHLSTLSDDLSKLTAMLDDLLAQSKRGVRLRDGLRVVLAGAPNVGKSSVLNRLAGEERAIVTAIAGTTRDVIRETIRIGDACIELMDTAGLRHSDDDVEKIGISRTVDTARSADLVLFVCDDREPVPAQLSALDTGGEVLPLLNKIDLTHRASGIRDGAVAVSALTGDGFDVLCRELHRRSTLSDGAGEFSARQRHVDCLREAQDFLRRASEAVDGGRATELAAEDLRQCQSCLGRITGAVTSDDLLGEIFSKFCIGK